jgi:hypothetical protein
MRVGVGNAADRGEPWNTTHTIVPTGKASFLLSAAPLTAAGARLPRVSHTFDEAIVLSPGHSMLRL